MKLNGVILVSGKVLYDIQQVLWIVEGGGFFRRERFEIQNDKTGRGERIAAPADNGGCTLAGSCSQN